MYRNRQGKRVRCLHRYKGLDGLYVPRFKKRKIDGEWKFVTEYECQIKGCKHWQIHFINTILARQTPEDRRNQPIEDLVK